MFDLKTYLASQNKRINDWLEARFKGSDTRILKAMSYSLMAGGKRIRPVLCIASAKAAGKETPLVLPCACAIEMIHTYSLIHDDLPAMDNDELRRGRPTCHIAFDEATAILAGDGLLTLAFEVLSELVDKNTADSIRILRIIREISRAAGARGMIEGQMRDMASEGVSLDIEALEKIHALKTGAMIEASVFAGGLMGGGGKKELSRLSIYAEKIGLAFQVADDILNVEGDPARMGKAVGTDATRNKNTYPAVMGRAESKEFARKLIREAVSALDTFDESADPLRALALYTIERKR